MWFLSFCAVLIIGIIGCGGDDNDADEDSEWVGTWALETVNGQSFEQDFQEDGINVSIITNNWTFNDDGTLEAEMGFKIEDKEGGSVIAITSSIKITGTYSLSGFNYTLTADGGFGSFDLDSDTTETDTGTWSRKGNTLTLTSDNDEVIVFKKK